LSSNLHAIHYPHWSRTATLYRTVDELPDDHGKAAHAPQVFPSHSSLPSCYPRPFSTAMAPLAHQLFAHMCSADLERDNPPIEPPLLSLVKPASTPLRQRSFPIQSLGTVTQEPPWAIEA
jgi:hypothetical protein